MKNHLNTAKKTELILASPRQFDSVRYLLALAFAVFLAAVPTTVQAQTLSPNDFVLKITTTAGTTATDVGFTFHTEGTNYDIDWGNDGMFEVENVSGNQSHSFSAAGEHTIRFRNLTDIYGHL